MVHRVTHWVTTLLYSIASLTLILAAFSLAGKALYEVYVSVLVEGKIDKDILNAITYTVIAIAVCDVGRFWSQRKWSMRKDCTLWQRFGKPLPVSWW